jgi:hypothetical protein
MAQVYFRYSNTEGVLMDRGGRDDVASYPLC